MQKHAYLIMAHNEPYILERLVKLLDDKRNDLYIHIDKKNKNIDKVKINSFVKKSKVYFTKSLDVRWGSSRQIDCELLLLEEATSRGNYGYYHLLSGVDFPLKTQDEIHSFFEKNNGKEFVCFCDFSSIRSGVIDRIKYYHLFTNNLRSSKKINLSQKLHSLFLKIQKLLKFNRIKEKENSFKYGANWFSITDDLARYVLENKKYIKKTFRYTLCADELFLQTLVFNSKFYDKLYLKADDGYSQIMRYVDWKRGNPYTFKLEDYDELMKSGMFFARKFSTSTDKLIIDKIYEKLRSDK